MLPCLWFPTNWKIETPFYTRIFRNTEAQIQGENSHDIINNDNTSKSGRSLWAFSHVASDNYKPKEVSSIHDFHNDRMHRNHSYLHPPRQKSKKIWNIMMKLEESWTVGMTVLRKTYRDELTEEKAIGLFITIRHHQYWSDNTNRTRRQKNSGKRPSSKQNKI